ncbi:MAG: transcriptional repressor [Chloroflexi bacterium AL-W]|nr:transcriptional repressor [Chloroflexi bacterium AL-N1]NOK67875.1 transcriptional repressor [Chloroflexi bacterium AL-N10]NOK75355.1 transcriptional repressor [Chloroflexi bacterium AL-N5]NOK82143.1 transcriptional repressor [Chloroflexi bacterium AL-W]NOK89988.1 transcriptional repressor [Chloroflexi bacterium AL-N15]
MPHCTTMIETLRQRGHRVTPQREMIIEALTHGGDHVTVENIFATVQTRSHAVNIATIYRTVEFLVKEGLVTRNDLGGDQIVYTTRYHGPHVHLVCRQCKKSVEATSASLRHLSKQLEEQYGFHTDIDHLSLFGLCAECQQKHP